MADIIHQPCLIQTHILSSFCEPGITYFFRTATLCWITLERQSEQTRTFVELCRFIFPCKRLAFSLAKLACSYGFIFTDICTCKISSAFTQISIQAIAVTQVVQCLKKLRCRFSKCRKKYCFVIADVYLLQSLAVSIIVRHL